MNGILVVCRGTVAKQGHIGGLAGLTVTDLIESLLNIDGELVLAAHLHVPIVLVLKHTGYVHFWHLDKIAQIRDWSHSRLDKRE